ncbi:MAG: Flp pilus assembly protein TadG [Rhodobacterales bacterium]|nr:MAG: Flp pilus assembly protein TadG [Rhodobacterales bacterium]
MFGAETKLLKRLKRAVLGEDGSATVEFVIIFPAIMTLFLSSFEVSIFLMRSVMLDRALDINVRALRLGKFGSTESDELKRRVCEAALVFKGCPDAVKIELTKVPKTTWALPNGRTPCVDRSAPLSPATTPLNLGEGNDLMVVRACAALDPVFGTTPMIMNLPVDATGAYMVTAASTFVNEPK